MSRLTKIAFGLEILATICVLLILFDFQFEELDPDEFLILTGMVGLMTGLVFSLISVFTDYRSTGIRKSSLSALILALVIGVGGIFAIVGLFSIGP